MGGLLDKLAKLTGRVDVPSTSSHQPLRRRPMHIKLQLRRRHLTQEAGGDRRRYQGEREGPHKIEPEPVKR